MRSCARSTNDRAHKYTDHPFVHSRVQLAGSTPGQPGGSAPGLGVMPTGISATTHAPITAAVLAFELSGDYGVVLPLLLATGAATVVARSLRARSIYQ